MKTIRIWVYGLLKYEWKIVTILKWRWPFKWLYDLPWWKIEHWEDNVSSLKRELLEELWLFEKDYKIINLLTVEEDFIKHIWEGEEKDEHIIAIVYEINIIKKDFNLGFIEEFWDANWIKLIDRGDNTLWKTSILKKVLEI